MRVVQAMYAGPIESSTPPDFDAHGKSTTDWPKVAFGMFEFTQVRDNPIGGGIWADGLEALKPGRFNINVPDEKTLIRLARALYKKYKEHIVGSSAAANPRRGRAAAETTQETPRRGRAAAAAATTQESPRRGGLCTPVRRSAAGSGRQSLTPDCNTTFGLDGFMQHAAEERKKRSKNLGVKSKEEIEKEDQQLKSGSISIGQILGNLSR